MSNLSVILNSKYPSPTTLVAALGGTSNVSYTPTSPVKVTIAYSSAGSGGSFNVNSVAFTLTANNIGSFVVNLGASQTLNVSTGSGITAVVSSERVN